MGEENFMTEEERIRRELEREEKEKRMNKVRKVALIVFGGLFFLIILLSVLVRVFLPDPPLNWKAKVRKPVIYLYPEETTEVSVLLDFNGELTTTYPAYDNGWRVVAEPDGTLLDENGREYYCLYWEGESDIDFDMSEGFCVKGSETAAFLEEALAKLGLTRREANEFIVYWLPLMEGNEYNVISFQTDAYTENAKLVIDPQPDTLIRVFMAWYGSGKPVEIPEQSLAAPERTGFTVVEWGGSEIR